MFDKAADKFLLYLERNWTGSKASFLKYKENAEWVGKSFGIRRTPGPGAPKKSFEESGDRSKRQKIAEVSAALATSSPNRTLKAAKKFVDSTLNSSAIDVSGICDEKTKVLSVSDSFDVFSSCSFSKREYSVLVEVLKSKGVVLKSYETIRSKILKKIKSDLPVTVRPNSVTIDASVAVSHSFLKIFETLNVSYEISELDFGIKFGFDGGQSMQSINFQSIEDQIDDKFMFLVYFCPLFIKRKDIFLWKNPNPNSVNSTLLLELNFIKENDAFSADCYQKYKSFFADDANFDFRVCFFPTMMDQKAINSCTLLKPGAKGCDTKKCFLCNKRTCGENSFQNFNKQTKCVKENLVFGISPLHALLNFTKFIIFNVSSELNGYSKEQLNSKLEEKYKIKFSEVQHGFGTKITGNVARLFFADRSSFAETISLPISFINDANAVLEMIRQTEAADRDIYSSTAQRLCKFLSEKEISLTPTVHKILHHGEELLEFFGKVVGLNTGVFSEEPGEGMIRKIRRIRAEHARMTNRVDNNYDTFVNSYLLN